MQHAVPQALVLAIGEQHRHLGLAVGELADDALHGGAGEPTIGTVDELQRHPLQAGAGPLLGQLRRPSPRRCTKCTVRISSGVSERAYWMARAEAMSRRSTNTSTTWRRRIGAVAAAGTSCSSWTASRSYCRLRRSSTITRIGMITSITQASSKRVMSTISTTPAESIAPTPLTTTPRCQPCSSQPQVVHRHARLRQREADEHADGVERDEPGDLGARDRPRGGRPRPPGR